MKIVNKFFLGMLIILYSLSGNAQDVFATWRSSTCTVHTKENPNQSSQCTIKIVVGPFYDNDRLYIDFDHSGYGDGYGIPFRIVNGQFNPGIGTLTNNLVDLSYKLELEKVLSHLQLRMTSADTAHVEWTDATSVNYGHVYHYSADMVRSLTN